VWFGADGRGDKTVFASADAGLCELFCINLYLSLEKLVNDKKNAYLCKI
jgi:F0F1-type ATP synthase gamma subunit